jgi:signal transduction histidine kinase
MVFDLGLVVTFSLCMWVVIDLLVAGGARERRLPFVALASTSGVWVLGELVGRRAATPEEYLLARRILHFGVSLLPVAWLVTAATAARAPWLRRAPWLALLPLASAAFTYSFLYWDHKGRFISGPYQTPEYGPMFWYSAGLAWILIVIGTGHFLAAASRFDRARPIRIAAVALGSTAPLIGNMLYVTGAIGNPDPTPLLIGAGGVALRFAIIDTGLSAMLHQASDAVFERLKTGVLLADLEGRVVDANPMARSLTAEPEPGGAALDELVARTLEQPDRVIDVERMPLRRTLGDLGQAVLLTDRTEAVQLENRLREAQRRESLQLLAAGVAHDFNNVLTVIRGCTERARLQLDGDHGARSSLTQLIEATRAAGRLVDQLLAYAGQHEGALRLLDLRSELEGLQMLANVAAGPRARLEFDLANDLPAVEANPVEIQQLLVNLVANAAQAMEEQGTIRVRAVSEQLTTADLEGARSGHDAGPGDYVLIEVSDEGRGMDASTLERIFDPFFTTREQGHGLGLAVLVGIVHSCGGALHVASTPGIGTTFRIHLPTAPAAA